MKKILVTGGAGYIGSHICVALKESGYEPIILDNLSNSSTSVIEALEGLCGSPIIFIEADIRNKLALEKTFSKHHIDGVIHCAGLKAVSESVSDPLKYYDNNVNGSLCLLSAMAIAGVKTIVFSSSATVYGIASEIPISEDTSRNAINPYGKTKQHIEDMLFDLIHSDPNWKIACLRYFNPVGAHESGLIGENPSGVPNNLMPYILSVAAGERPYVNVWGSDYETIDGTGVRDYIHVCDLAEGHISALKKISSGGVITLNLGTGKGYSVLEVIKEFEISTGQSVPYKISPRRAGDIDAYWANPNLSNELLAWKAKRNLTSMCIDSWRWWNFKKSELCVEKK